MSNRPINVASLEGLQEVLQRFVAAHRNNDIDTQQDTLSQLVKREQNAYEYKLKLLAELKTLLQETKAARGTKQRIARLITAFKFAAELRAIGCGDLDDQETGVKAQDAIFDLYDQLKAIAPEGMAALVELLDDPSVPVRASVSVLLLRQMPERAIPIIEEIERTARGTDASISAGFALRRYKSEREAGS